MGVFFDTMYTFSHHIKETVEKAKGKVNALKSISGVRGHHLVSHQKPHELDKTPDSAELSPKDSHRLPDVVQPTPSTQRMQCDPCQRAQYTPDQAAHHQLLPQ